MHTANLLSLLATYFSLLTPIFASSLQDSNLDSSNSSAIRLLYQYPLGTWIENIAVRPSGELLLTLLNTPVLDQLDPFQANATPHTIHNFTGYEGLTGISEIAPDTFAVSTGNFSFTSGAQKGSWTVWGVEFPSTHGVNESIEEIAPVPAATFLNGMTTLSTSKTPQDVLVGDIRTGAIYRVDTTSGTSAVVLNDTLTAPVLNPVFGTTAVDGIRTQNNTLYFTNAGKDIFAGQPIHPDGTPSGPAKVIQQVRNESEFDFYFDDFALNEDYAYLVTGSGNSIERIALNGTGAEIIAGGLNSTLIAGPTSAAFGRTKKDSHILYVVTSGALAAPVNGNITVGAQVLALDTRRLE